MIRRLLSYSGTYRLFGHSEMAFLETAFPGDLQRVCRVRLEGGQP